MEKRETRDKKNSTGCCGFGNANMDPEKMAEMANSCCDGGKGSPSRSGSGKKMMRTMMEMCCGSKAERKERCSGNDNA